MIAAHLYRIALAEIGRVSCDAAMLLPEIIVVTAMGLVSFYDISHAFLLLVGGQLFMALTVVVINTYRLCHYSGEDTVSSKELSSEESIV